MWIKTLRFTSKKDSSNQQYDAWHRTRVAPHPLIGFQAGFRALGTHYAHLDALEALFNVSFADLDGPSARQT